MNTPDIPTQTYYTLLNAVCSTYKDENKKIDFTKINRSTTFPFKNRELTVHWVKIPTFTMENRQKYYAVFLADLNPRFIYKMEIKGVVNQCWEAIDNHDIDSNTIFIYSKQKDFIPKYNPVFQNHKVYIHNTALPLLKHKRRTLKHITNLLQKRVEGVKEKPALLSYHVEECRLLEKLIETINKDLYIYSYSTKRNTKRTSYNNSFSTKSNNNNRITYRDVDVGIYQKHNLGKPILHEEGHKIFFSKKSGGLI